DEPAPGRFELAQAWTRGERAVARKQPLVLAELRVEECDLGQVGVVGLAQLRRVDDRVQVSDLAPGALEAILRGGERLDEILPRRRCGVRRALLDCRAVLRAPRAARQA